MAIIALTISTSSKYKTHITPKGLGFFQSLKELLQFRHLLLRFAKRDYKVRYAQTYIGYWWSILQPAASVAILYLVFAKMVGVETESIGYLPFALSGLLLWNYFNYVITQSSSSLINAQNMIRKIYFPKICLPLSKALVGLVSPMVGLLLLIPLLFWEKQIQWVGVLLFPVSLLFTALASLGIGLWASALSIRFRDLQQIIPYVLQFLFFLTPIAYSSKLADKIIPENYEFLIYLNPMSGIIEGQRAVLFDQSFSPYGFVSYILCLLLFVSGVRYFQKVEMKIADII